MEILYVNYNRAIVDPRGEFAKVYKFLDPCLNLEKMTATVDPTLYRNRSSLETISQQNL